MTKKWTKKDLRLIETCRTGGSLILSSGRIDREGLELRQRCLDAKGDEAFRLVLLGLESLIAAKGAYVRREIEFQRWLEQPGGQVAYPQSWQEQLEKAKTRERQYSKERAGLTKIKDRLLEEGTLPWEDLGTLPENSRNRS